MKRILLFAVVLMSSTIQAQMFGVRLGYSGSFTDLEGLNQVVENYNTSRQWLEQEMKNFGYLDGYTIGITSGARVFWFDMEYSTRGQKRKASGVDLTGNLGTRSLKLKNNTFAFTLSGVATNSNGGIGFGLRTELGANKLKTKVEYANESDAKWNVVQKDLAIKMGPAMRVVNRIGDSLEMSFSIYYVFGLSTTNFTEADIAINNTFYNSTTPEQFDVNNHTFGFALTLGFINMAY